MSKKQTTVCLEHRRLLYHAPGFRPFRGTDLFERIGGQPTIDRLIDHLYEGFENDEQLRPLFPRDLADGRSMQKLFFAEWLGGPRRYSEQSQTGLQHRHDGLPITSALASRWLGHFRRAMEATVTAENDRRTIFAQVRALALALVTEQVAPGRKVAHGHESQDGLRQVAWCGQGARSVARARDLAHRGDVAGLGTALAEAPDLLRPSYAAAIMQAAALAGRAEIVRMLLDRGVGADHPFYLPVSVTGVAFERVVFVTPLCAARMKRRSAVESLLMAAGANEDVFTSSALLGDLTSLARMLAADPNLAQATDPAVDVLDITPVEHAVAGGQVSALRLIFDHVAHPLPGCVRALRGAAARAAWRWSSGCWHRGGRDTDRRRTLGPSSRARSAAGQPGAAIDSSGSWIGASCTGNEGRKDDPEYVRALLHHGASANDRRAGDPEGTTGVRALNATALHYAARAGFLRTIEVLIDHGADPDARDSHGRTPLDWLEQAAPSVSRAAVRNLIAPS